MSLLTHIWVRLLPSPDFQRRDEVLAQYSFKADRFVIDQVLMVVFMLVFYLIGYIGLTIRIYRAR